MKLKRQVGSGQAIFLGLGSMLGTGLFLSLAYATQTTGAYMIFALMIAGFVAFCNAFNSAQLAANYPTSGGAYEYGYQLLNPTAGFIAGWNFLLAKSASAAASAIGFAYTLQNFIKISVPLTATLTVVILTAFVTLGLRKSNILNFIFVSILLTALFTLIVSCFVLEPAQSFNLSNLMQDAPFSLQNFLKSTALLFVAYTGYGRIATLGEEIRDPRRNIPKSIAVTIFITLGLYLAVSFISLKFLGPQNIVNSLNQKEVPLLTLAANLNQSWLALFLTIAMSLSFLSVLLNLILGLSRVILAMARRQDAPQFLKKLNANQTSPTAAVLLIGVYIALLAYFLPFEKNWAMSAFSVLIYYGILNLSAWKLEKSQRLYPKWLTFFGIVGCFFLAFWVDWQTWLIGLGLIAFGLILRIVMKSFAHSK